MNRNSQPLVETTRPADAGILLTLALCALLGAGTSVTGAMTGIALLLIVTLTVLISASIRSLLPPALQAAAFVVIFAGCVTAMELFLRAWWPAQYREPGIFLLLTVAAAPLLANAEVFAPGRTRTESLNAAVAMGLAFACVTPLLGGLRELVGSTPGEGSGFLLALLPPGALIAMGVLIAIWNWFAERARRP